MAFVFELQWQQKQNVNVWDYSVFCNNNGNNDKFPIVGSVSTHFLQLPAFVFD